MVDVCNSLFNLILVIYSTLYDFCCKSLVMVQDMDWDDLANMWWTKFEHMETDRTPRQGIKRGRSRSRTPATRKRSDRAPSRAKGMQPRKLTFSSARTRSRSRSASEPRKKLSGKAAFFARSPPGEFPAETERRWRKTAQGKRNQATANRLLKTRKVRHKLTRKDARKTMPRGGKPYMRPKGRKGYRGAVMPRWAKGETKHVLIQDSQADLTSAAGTTDEVTAATSSSIHAKLDIGDIKQWSMNPIAQGTGRSDRNGASVDGTYLRIQGHIHNVSKSALNQIDGQVAQDAGKQRAYVRMLVLAVKGGRGTGHTDASRPKANFDATQLFKKIDGTVVGFSDSVGTGNSSDRIRTLQLGVNKQSYTLLADRKYELSGSAEGFGASDRLFDLKMKLKQRTTFADEHVDSWEKNQICFVVMTVDPNMDDSALGNAGSDSRKQAIQLEFESKYSYKDF